MPIIKHHTQPKKSLYEFYNELVESDNVVSQKIGYNMIKLIEDLNIRLKETTLFAFTSLYSTNLSSVDENNSNSFVKIITDGNTFSMDTENLYDNYESFLNDLWDIIIDEISNN